MHFNSRRIGFAVAFLQVLLSVCSAAGLHHHGGGHAHFAKPPPFVPVPPPVSPPPPVLSPPPFVPPPVASSKKGVSALYQPNVEGVMEDLMVSWYFTYTLSTYDVNTVPPVGVSFVPMFFNSEAVTPANLQLVESEANDINVLTFYSPDQADQGFTSVDEAIAVWSQLESLNKRLGAPATYIGAFGNAWLDEFMQQVEQQGLRVDFIPVKYYITDPALYSDIELAVEDLKSVVQNIFRTYKKPVWLIEFGIGDYFDPMGMYVSAETHAAFVTQACDMLNRLNYLERFAYFPLYPVGTNMNFAHLYETDGSITPVGEAYKKCN